MKSITWVTPDYFLQVDMPVLADLNKKYNIKWAVIARKNSEHYRRALSYANENQIDVEFFEIKRHRYSPLNYFEYKDIFVKLSKNNSDVYYIDMVAFPFALFAIQKCLPMKKVVFAMHHGKTHSAMDFRFLYECYLNYISKTPAYFQFFSSTQASFFKGDKSKICVIPLAINDFGKSDRKPDTDIIQFLFFGLIIETKNLELLIFAANTLYEKIGNKFKVKIVGSCNNWDSQYSQLIKQPEIFDLTIQKVPDAVIPELFSTSHYLVLPYKAVTQSGPLRIAYGYNTPVIASDLDGFKESVVEGTTGYLFKSDSVESLAEMMEKVVNGGFDFYKEIKQKQATYVDENLSIGSACDKYCQMFDQIG